MKTVNIQEKQILVDGLKVNYKIIGDGNIPIILLHGWGVNSDKYIETAKHIMISASGGPAVGGQFSIIMPDLPGFGKSDNPPEPWGVDEYAEFVREFIQGLSLDFKSKDSPWIIIGHSFGGRIAIKFAAKYPEKLKALILTGAAGIKHTPTLRQKIFYALAKQGKAVFSLPILNYLQKPAKKLLYKAVREKDYYQAKGVIKETFKKIIAEDLTPCLEKIKTPTLLVWGANDKSTPPRDAYIMKEKISAHGGPAVGGKNCKLKIIGNADHRLPYQKPKEFAQIVLDFIKNTNA